MRSCSTLSSWEACSQDKRNIRRRDTASSVDCEAATPINQIAATIGYDPAVTMCRAYNVGKDSMDIQNIVSDLKTERDRLDQAIAALEGVSSSNRRGRPTKGASTIGRRRRHMSAAARKRISAAMKQRWAQRKRKSAPKQAKPVSKKAVRRPMSPAARKKLSALMKARWAAKKKASA